MSRRAEPFAVPALKVDQKEEARRYAEVFVGERLPQFLGYFEDLLQRNERSEGRRHYPELDAKPEE